MADALVTGGAGFIGSYLIELLLSKGRSVTILDDLSTGNLENCNYLNSVEAQPTNVEFVEGSILDEELLQKKIKDSAVVYHFAATVGVRKIINNPIESLRNNLTGSENVIRLCAKYGKKLFFASTSEVYGKQDHSPLVESDNCVYGDPRKLRWSYASGKLVSESYAISYADEHDIPVTIGRIFNAVGARQTGEYGMVVPRMVEQAISGSPITVYGNGSQTRTFCHVKEVAQCIYDLVERSRSGVEIVNIGGCEELSINDLAEKIKMVCASQSDIIKVPYEEAYNKNFEEIYRRVPSVKKLRSLIGYSPSKSIYEVINDVAAYEVANKAANKATNKATDRVEIRTAS